MNGFEMLDVLGDLNFSIIFTTAHGEFAAKAFRISDGGFVVLKNNEKLSVSKAKKEMLMERLGLK